MASLFQKVMSGFRKFPGIGQKTAEKLTFHALSMKEDEIRFFAESLLEFRRNTKICGICGLVSEVDPCRICRDEARDKTTICVVKDVQDAFTVEKSRGFQGRYHVLGGLVSPLDDVSEKDLSIPKLLQRIKAPIAEILFAFESNLESEATVKAVRRALAPYPDLKFSRLAVGIPAGTGLEFIDADTLKKSIQNRYSL